MKKHFFRAIGRGFLQLSLLGLLIANSAFAAEVAAYTQFVVGDVSATSQDGDQRYLGRGDLIYSGDSIDSGPEGSAQLLFMDNSRMAVRVNTRFRIDNYHYDANRRDQSRSYFSLLRGAIRSITGLIGGHNKKNVLFKTPVATIGVRGTDHEIVHITESFNNGRSPGLSGSYNKVYEGATYLQSNKGRLELDRNEVGFVAGTSAINAEIPVRLERLPEIIEQTLVRYIPLQSNTDPVNPASRLSDSATILLDGGGDAINRLAARLEPTTETLTATLNSAFNGELLNNLSAKSLDPVVNSVGATTSGLTQDLSSGGLLTGGSSLPVTNDPLVVPVIPVIPGL